MLYGKLLKTLRKKKHFTQQEVADGILTSRVKYSRYETDLIPMDDETLFFLAKFYGTTTDDFRHWAKLFNDPDFPFNILLKNDKADV